MYLLRRDFFKRKERKTKCLGVKRSQPINTVKKLINQLGILGTDQGIFGNFKREKNKKTNCFCPLVSGSFTNLKFLTFGPLVSVCNLGLKFEISIFWTTGLGLRSAQFILLPFLNSTLDSIRLFTRLASRT